MSQIGKYIMEDGDTKERDPIRIERDRSIDTSAEDGYKIDNK